jgi:hypothetical protein
MDIQYHRVKQRFCVNHDNTWTCDRDDLLPFLRKLRGFNSEGLSPSLIIFDFKSDGGYRFALRDLLRLVRDEYSSQTPAKIVVSVAKLSTARRLMPKMDQLKLEEGLAIDQENNADAVGRFLIALDKGGGRGFGNGTFAYGISLNIRRSIR